MKKLFIILLAMAALVAVPMSAKKKQALLRFTEQTYNFGTISEKGGKVSHKFEFVNDGDANLIIVDATADCGCTVPEFPSQPIAPGKKGYIKVTYNPLYRPGSFTKTITVRSNSKQKKTRIKISGTVNPNK